MKTNIYLKGIKGCLKTFFKFKNGGIMKDIEMDKKLDKIFKEEKKAKKELEICEKKYGSLSEQAVLQRRIYNGYHSVVMYYRKE